MICTQFDGAIYLDGSLIHPRLLFSSASKFSHFVRYFFCLSGFLISAFSLFLSFSPSTDDIFFWSNSRMSIKGEKGKRRKGKKRRKEKLKQKKKEEERKKKEKKKGNTIYRILTSRRCLELNFPLGDCRLFLVGRLAPPLVFSLFKEISKIIRHLLVK